MSAEAISPDPHVPRPFIATAPALAALAPLEHGFGARAPFVLLTGREGMGKRTLVREALVRLDGRAWGARCPSPWPAAEELANALIGVFGGRELPGKPALAVRERLLETLGNVTAAGRVAVLVVHDAHTLTGAHLSQLARIAGDAAGRQCPMEVWLVGAPSLEKLLNDSTLGSVREQVAVHVKPAPLSPTDTRHYLQMRPTASGVPSTGLFSRKASRDIHAVTQGVPALVEWLAQESATRALRASAAIVSPEHVRAAASVMRSGRFTAVQAAPAPEPQPGPARTPSVTRAAEPATTTPAPAPRPSSASTPKPAAAESAPAQRPSSANTPRPVAAQSAPAPRPSAANTPRPAVVAASAGSSDAPAKDDPRVQEWLSRFGGAGSVSVGGSYMKPLTAAEQLDDPAAGGTAGDEPVLRRGHRGPIALPRARGPVLGRRGGRVSVSTVVAVVACAALAVVLAQRHGVPQAPNGAAVATVTRSPAQGERAHASAEEIERARAKRAARRAEAEAVRVPRFAIVAGAYLEKSMARAEEDHLSRLVKYRVWIMPYTLQGVQTYRLMLGSFETRDAAESTAETLLQRGLLRDANVVKLPPSSMGGGSAR